MNTRFNNLQQTVHFWNSHFIAQRLAVNVTKALAVFLSCLPISQASAQLRIDPLNDMVLDANALVLPTSGNFARVINGRTFQQEALITFGEYQFTAWYQNGAADEDILVARRHLSGTTWEVIDTGYGLENGDDTAILPSRRWDAHNSIAIGISGDGRIHLSYDQHADILRYLTTDPGFATSSSSVWNQANFKLERNSLNEGGGTIPQVTYPRFTKVGDDLIFTYRERFSSNGDHFIATYNAQTGLWNNTRKFIDGLVGTYTHIDGNPSPRRNAYLNGFDVDLTGRLHITWTFRENSSNANHDLHYAFSDDNGQTWNNNDGVSLGTIITLNSPGIEVVDLDSRQAFINQQGQVVDDEGGVHVLARHRRQEPGFEWQPGDGTFDGSDSAYHHHYRNPATGVWEFKRLPVEHPVNARPKIGVDPDGNLFGIYTSGRDLIIAGAERILGGYSDWAILRVESVADFEGDPLLDPVRLTQEGILSIFLQERAPTSDPEIPTGTPLHVLEYDIIPPRPPGTYDSLIAGWDTWDNGTNPAASFTAVGIAASAATASEGLAWHVLDGRGASADGDWGTFADLPTASTIGGDGVQNENLELSNATTGGTITFTITNNGDSDIELDGFHFDAYAFRPKAARSYELSVTAGDITNGVIYTSTDDEISSVGGAWDNNAHDDISHSLVELADHTLEAGGTVSFLLAFSSGFGDGSGGHDLWIDNVAVTGTPLTLLGDFDNDGDVDLFDLDQYNGNLGAAATGTLEDLDLNGDGTVGADDFEQHYGTLVETSNGGKGTLAGDLNLDGTVDVLGDAFALVSNLGNNSATSWAQGDINADGIVNVLGDAFALVGNLGNTNE